MSDFGSGGRCCLNKSKSKLALIITAHPTAAQVQELVGVRASVPKDAVLPVLERLGRLQQALRAEQRLLLQRQRLWEALTAAAAAAGPANAVPRVLGFQLPPGSAGVAAGVGSGEGLTVTEVEELLGPGMEYVRVLERGVSGGGRSFGGFSSSGGQQQQQQGRRGAAVGSKGLGLELGLAGGCPVSLANWAAAVASSAAAFSGAGGDEDAGGAEALPNVLQLAEPVVGAIR